MPLTLPSVASVFVKLQRAKDRAKTDTLDFCSGDPQTHPCLFGEGTTPRNRVSLVHSDLFTCKGAVDVPKLLRASRASLLEKAEYLGGNILVEESWGCTIRMPKVARQGSYRVRVRYCAFASRSSRPDPQKPVALDKVRNVPGLMTILHREEVSS
ncbi:hypothetical protein SCLCIDRAFT_100849 [Scleroderma citrinum Foug A]|uniref:Uncharacterized protein n=1 Tax=Scleroderma citrinum Foug A TaxID=1036808 RepID=A0A0C3ES62_9AGAM|nr:hypothetical protein SCLCIDRAFT_100849 [Scleroderma citrinum Foug A]